MAFTRGWDSTTPAGSRAAAQIDDSSREKQVDIEERLIGRVFVSMPNTTVESDLVVHPTISSVVTTRVYNIGALQMSGSPNLSPPISSNIPTSSNASAGWIHLPEGITLTGLDATTDKRDGISVTVKLVRISRASIAQTDVAGFTVTRTASGGGTDSTGVISHVVDSLSFMYYLVASKSGGIITGLFYGTRLYFDRDDSRNCF